MIAGMCRGLTGFWCTDGYAVCGYAEAAVTSKDIVVSMDGVGVSKTPGLRVNAPPSARSRPIRIGCSAGLGTGSAECCVFSSIKNHLWRTDAEVANYPRLSAEPRRLRAHSLRSSDRLRFR